jgi:hypothetical protein
MLKFNLVNRKTLKELIEITNSAVSKGYEPIGSIVFFDGFYIQAIVFKPSIIQRIKNKYTKKFNKQKDSSMSETLKEMCNNPSEFMRLMKIAMPDHPIFKTEKNK